MKSIFIYILWCAVLGCAAAAVFNHDVYFFAEAIFCLLLKREVEELF